jgi:hypothetical protein
MQPVRIERAVVRGSTIPAVPLVTNWRPSVR